MKLPLLLLLVTLLATAPDGAQTAEPSRQASEPSTAAPAAAPDDELEEFVPSEEISADRAISFPVDI